MNTFTEREIRLMAVAGIGSLIIGIVGTSLILRMGERNEVAHTPATEEEIVAGTLSADETPDEAPQPLIAVVDQPAGRAVTVQNIEMPALGWVVVHEMDDNGDMRNALGAALRDTGEHESVVVELLRATEPGKEYRVVLYADNGDKKFGVRVDSPFTDEGGEMMAAQFTAFTPVSPSGR